jgi:putative secretion ATPase (PEP-CTERM system associated)
MYERFYNLRERPFALSPDPDYLYPSRVHREALGYLRYGIEGYAGFVVITGDIGCGKTTLLQTVLRGLDRQTSISRLVNTMLDARELIEAVMLDFGLNPAPGLSKPHLLRELARYLVEQRQANRLALLVIDEAQNLSLPALEEVRMLSNLETEKSKLLQIVLVGQPNLRDLMSRPELEQLRQRVTVSYHLQPLASDETAAYVNHRLQRAAAGTPLQFPPDVTELIHRHSGGVPRKINIIADAILLFGYGEERRVIDLELTEEVIEELRATGVIAAPQTVVAPGAVAASAAPPFPSAPGSPPPTTIPTLQIERPASGPEHDRGLAAREAMLADRERQLAEQQRLLFEGYRLLRAQHDQVASSSSGPSAAAASASAPASSFAGPGSPQAAAPGLPPAARFAADQIRLKAPAERVSRPPSAADRLGSAARVSSYAAYRPDTARGPREPMGEPEGFWLRLRRGLFGVKPLLEE